MMRLKGLTQNSSPLLPVALLIVVLVGGLIAALPRSSFSAKPVSPRSNSRTSPSLASERVVAKGVVQAEDLHRVICETEEASTLLNILPEGSQVSQGQVLAQLDSAKLEKRRRDLAIQVAQHQAALQTAHSLATQHDVETARQLSAAVLTTRLAQLDQDRFLKGESVIHRVSLKTAVKFAKLRALHAQKHLQWSHWLAGKGYLNQAQIEVDQESQKRARLSLESAENLLRVYEQSTYPRRKIELESRLSAARQELERVEAQSSATGAARLAQIDAADFAYQTRLSELRRVEEQVQHCTVRSPRDGILVYPPSHQPEGTSIEAGVLLKPWQTIVLLSPLKEFQVRASLDREQADRVAPGQSAEIHVEELPDKSFWGTVEQVKPLSSKLVGATKKPREILVLVRIHNPSPRLWPEMIATAKIDTSAEIRVPGKPIAIKTSPVTSGPLVGTVERRSKLELDSSVAIQSEVDGDMVIRSLAPDGSRVSKGQALVQLSSTPLREEFANQSVVVAEAKAAYDLAQKNLRLQQSQGLGKRRVAELELDATRLMLQEYQTGSFPQECNTLQDEISRMQQRVNQARQRRDWSERVIKKGYITESMLETDRLTVSRRQGALQAIQDKLELLEKYSYPHRVASLQGAIHESEQELDRLAKLDTALIDQAQAEFDAKRLALDIQQKELDRIDRQIAGCSLRAPCDGVVVHALQSDAQGQPGNPIGRGSVVGKYHTIMILAKLEPTHASISVEQPSSEQVQVGQDVSIRIDPVSQRAIPTKVAGVLPAEPSRGKRKRRPATTSITLEHQPQLIPWLTPNRTAIVEVRIHLENVLQLPARAVVQEGDKSFCYVRTSKGIERREFTPGIRDDRSVQVVAGLLEGAKVVANPNDVMNPREKTAP